jgi:putative component of membrane protein insertase Oxa1/YidC/SpoIIIJ protein YidD
MITSLITIARPLIGYAGCCKFELSCTQYAKQALHQFKWHKACWLILKRFLSCW